jgi:hypothetical protein
MCEPRLGLAVAIALEFEMTQREQGLRPAGALRQCRSQSRCGLVSPALAMQDYRAVEEGFRRSRLRSDQAIVGAKRFIEFTVGDEPVGIGQLLGEGK